MKNFNKATGIILVVISASCLIYDVLARTGIVSGTTVSSTLAVGITYAIFIIIINSKIRLV